MIKLGSKHQSVSTAAFWIYQARAQKQAGAGQRLFSPGAITSSPRGESEFWLANPDLAIWQPRRQHTMRRSKNIYVCEKLLLVVVVLLFSLEYFSILPARLDFSSIYILERNIRIVLNKGLYSKTWKQLFFLAIIGSEGFEIWVSAMYQD